SVCFSRGADCRLAVVLGPIWRSFCPGLALAIGRRGMPGAADGTLNRLALDRRRFLRRLRLKSAGFSSPVRQRDDDLAQRDTISGWRPTAALAPECRGGGGRGCVAA